MLARVRAYSNRASIPGRASFCIYTCPPATPAPHSMGACRSLHRQEAPATISDRKFHSPRERGQSGRIDQFRVKGSRGVRFSPQLLLRTVRNYKLRDSDMLRSQMYHLCFKTRCFLHIPEGIRCILVDNIQPRMQMLVVPEHDGEARLDSYCILGVLQVAVS